MIKLFKGFALAFSMLTILPFFRVHDFFKGINGYAVMFYPFVGFIVGLILWGAYELLAPYFLHVGVIVFALWVLITGALHLDGFCDSVDGFFVPKQRALQIMKDPHNGGMGMIFGGTFLILKASSLAVFDAFYLLPAVLMLSRFNAVLAIYFYPYVSQSGMSTLAKQELKALHVAAAFVYVLILGSWELLLISVVLFLLIKEIFVRRYGGFSGDMYGFLIEVSELLLLNIIIGLSL